MTPLRHPSLVCGLGALLAGTALAQTAPPNSPPAVPPMPTAPGQPAAPTSPAEMGRPALPAGVGTGAAAARAGSASEPTAPVAPTTPTAPAEAAAPRVQRAGTVDYLSGGAGAESRAAMETMQGRFTLRNVFSGQGGQYVVPDKVIVRGASGPATEITNAGPLLMLALPPGRYTIEAVVGGQVQSKTVTLSQQPVQLSWNWPGA